MPEQPRKLTGSVVSSPHHEQNCPSGASLTHHCIYTLHISFLFNICAWCCNMPNCYVRCRNAGERWRPPPNRPRNKNEAERPDHLDSLLHPHLPQNVSNWTASTRLCRGKTHLEWSLSELQRGKLRTLKPLQHDSATSPLQMSLLLHTSIHLLQPNTKHLSTTTSPPWPSKSSQ